ncbi:hypothetical protein ASG25_21455 [Rhizobium sp. Leaf384]|uniref:helix-turn-helix domain-containing protein n=1 Tax=Rhizobium sp. Leaf384 TaxID=1736358 RepID=UPI0007155687|nr:helix-turn-helix domain-containing protein [Rhizobium sp. Leaf384]KQS74045.1 hypothetical protein ASG25_21455 [Rhizobium sp. Leaf384]
MSFDATNWAIKQRGLRPAAKLVLWHLCDRYHPDYGCFPSQDTLADDCELPRSTLNVHLNDLEAAGLIAREQRRTKGTRRQESTRYRFPFEPGFERQNAQKPRPETGHGSDEAVSRNRPEPCPENGESRVQNLDSNPVREPVSEPVNLREGGRGASEKNDQPSSDAKKAEAAFWKLVKNWPGFDGMPKEPALIVWMKLSDDEREQATVRFPAWLAMLKAQKKSHVPAPSTYFREKLWTAAPDPVEAAKPKTAIAGPFGKLWMATRFAELLLPHATNIPGPTGFEQAQIRAGKLTLADVKAQKVTRFGWPLVNAMHESAADRRPTHCPLALEDAASDFRQVHRESPLFEAWMAEHERRGWPTLDRRRVAEWVYFPAVDDGEAPAVALERFVDAISDYLTTRRQGDEHAA